jgi:hypothetical protein
LLGTAGWIMIAPPPLGGLTVGVLLGTVVMVGAILAPDPPILEMVMLAATPLTF